MWLDWWHPDRIIYKRFSHRVVYDAGSKVEAKLSSVLNDKVWSWQPARSYQLVNFQSKLPMVRIGVVFFFFGSYLKKEPILVQKLGMPFVPNCQNLTGEI